MQLNSAVTNGMLNNIKDPKLRAMYGNILNGDFPYLVYCMEPQALPGEKKLAHKPGELIGYMDLKGRVIDEPKIRKDGEIISGIISSRDRFDGRKGFQCYCGNDSKCSEQEKPFMVESPTPNQFPPTKEDIQNIFAAIHDSNAPQGMEFTNGVLEYDGFKVEENQ